MRMIVNVLRSSMKYARLCAQVIIPQLYAFDLFALNSNTNRRRWTESLTASLNVLYSASVVDNPTMKGIAT